MGGATYREMKRLEDDTARWNETTDAQYVVNDIAISCDETAHDSKPTFNTTQLKFSQCNSFLVKGCYVYVAWCTVNSTD